MAAFFQDFRVIICKIISPGPSARALASLASVRLCGLSSRLLFCGGRAKGKISEWERKIDGSSPIQWIQWCLCFWGKIIENHDAQIWKSPEAPDSRSKQMTLVKANGFSNCWYHIMVSVAFDFDLFSHAQTKSVLGLLLAPPAFFFPSPLASPGAFFLFLASCTQHWHVTHDSYSDYSELGSWALCSETLSYSKFKTWTSNLTWNIYWVTDGYKP